MPTSSKYTQRVQWKSSGRYVDGRTHEQLERAEVLFGEPIAMAQGSWSNSPLSAGTHNGPGAADVYPARASSRTAAGYKRLETCLRAVGLAAWFRPWENHPGARDNWHCHGISIGNPYLPWLAALQVTAYIAGFNGLGRNARGGYDTGTRLYTHVTWESYVEQHNLPDIENPAQEDDVTLKEVPFWRRKNQSIKAGSWEYVEINDNDDISFATGPSKVVGGSIRPGFNAIPAGTNIYLRLVQDDVDARGKAKRHKTGETLVKLHAGDEQASIAMSLTLGSAAQGLTRRLRIQIYASKPVVLDRIGVNYFKES